MDTDGPTPYADVNGLVAILLGALRETLGGNLVGLGIFGSVVTGNYEAGISDVDFVAALRGDLDGDDGARVERMHAGIVAAHPGWRERVEVGYLAMARLWEFEIGMPMGRISPGEPFHLTTAGAGWLFNLASLRERGIGVWGLGPAELVPPISAERLRAGLGDLMRDWVEYLAEEPPLDAGGQGYMTLTMCRARAMAETGANLGKLEAAAWAARALPAWAPLIRRAVAWREATALGTPIPDDPARSCSETLAFARESIEAVMGRLATRA